MRVLFHALVLALMLAMPAAVLGAGQHADGVAHNLADPGIRDVYDDAVKKLKPKSGVQSRLLEALKTRPSAASASKKPAPPIKILGFSTSDGSQIATTAIVVPAAGTLSTSLTLSLSDSKGAIIDIGTQSSDGERPITLTIGPGTKEDAGPVDALARVHVIYETGGSDDFVVAINGAVFPENVVNRAPAVTKEAASNKWIEVCIDRATPTTASPPACNYVFGSVPEPPGALIPVSGSIKYPGAIDIDSNGRPANAEATLLIVNGDAMGPCRYADIGSQLLADPNTKAVGDTLQWSIDPAVFAASCATTASFYTFALVVKVEVGGQPAWGTISNAVNASTATTIAIPRLRLTAGCIAAGTLVTLASGETKPVESLKAGDQIKSEIYDLSLAAIASGLKDKRVTITTEAGNILNVSLIHPVITERGPVQAQELRLGDTLTTIGGPVKIKSLLQEVLPEPVTVYDLVLTPPAGSATQGWTFYASGLLVGDGAMKVKLAAAKP